MLLLLLESVHPGEGKIRPRVDHLPNLLPAQAQRYPSIHLHSPLDHVPLLLKYLSEKFVKIRDSGKKDKLDWNAEAEVYVLNEVMREGVQIYF